MTVEKILLGGNEQAKVYLHPKMANRHGLIAGATGTGKTISLQILAEQFSQIGVPVFLADVKGDLSGLAEVAKLNDKIKSRLDSIGLDHFNPKKNPVLFWDMFSQLGHPLRTTISDVGPLMLSNLLTLNDTQSGVLYSCFDFADDNGLLLLDLKDLRAMLSWMSDNKKALGSDYGNISSASIGSIQRKLLVLEQQGAENFFGEPSLNLNDLMITDFSGQGVISVMDVSSLMNQSPKLYATFLLWLLAELYEQLPEVGELEKPKLVLFFDEAHLIFDQAEKALIDKMEQVVRLIRSKGVGIYFISQNPADIPASILGQLGTRIQHALRAFTVRDQKAVRAAAETFRANPLIDSEEAITQLATGEALVSVLTENGTPTPVERILIRPPESRIGPLSLDERKVIIQRSPLNGRYDQVIDRESAYELLKARSLESERTALAVKAKIEQEKVKAKQESKRKSNRQGIGETIIKSAARSIGSSLGRKIMRGLLGSLLGGR